LSDSRLIEDVDYANFISEQIIEDSENGTMEMLSQEQYYQEMEIFEPLLSAFLVLCCLKVACPQFTFQAKIWWVLAYCAIYSLDKSF
jgi:hypothetical protein